MALTLSLNLFLQHRSAIYFPCACVWLAVLNNEEINFASYLLLIILSTVGSAGAAPVPSSGLVLVITAYNTVFGSTGTPAGFEFIVGKSWSVSFHVQTKRNETYLTTIAFLLSAYFPAAIDWLVDRIITALNVSGDACVCAIVACRANIDEEEVPDLANTGVSKRHLDVANSAIQARKENFLNNALDNRNQTFDDADEISN